VNVLRATDADVVALQEIQPTPLGREQVARLVRLLNIAADFDGTAPYEFEVSSVFTGDETTAFLWRTPVSKTGSVSLLPHDADPDGDGLPAFQRVPALSSFRAGNYDFVLVNVHLYTR
jgi:endonuclease/exonuclease/phosphatase family metal-dependent hydrolase